MGLDILLPEGIRNHHGSTPDFTKINWEETERLFSLFVIQVASSLSNPTSHTAPSFLPLELN